VPPRGSSAASTWPIFTTPRRNGEWGYECLVRVNAILLQQLAFTNLVHFFSLIHDLNVLFCCALRHISAIQHSIDNDETKKAESRHAFVSNCLFCWCFTRQSHQELLTYAMTFTCRGCWTFLASKNFIQQSTKISLEKSRW